MSAILYMLGATQCNEYAEILFFGAAATSAAFSDPIRASLLL